MSKSDSFEVFRKAVKEFKAADEAFDKQSEGLEKGAKEQADKISGIVDAVDKFSTACRSYVEAGGSSPVDLPAAGVSPATETALKNVKQCLINIQRLQSDITQIEAELEALDDQLGEALVREEKERSKAEVDRRAALLEAERQRQEALRKELETRRRKTIFKFTAAAVLLLVVIILHFILLKSTTLSFGMSLDGVAIPANRIPRVVLDGNEFASGGNIKLGRHRLYVQLSDCEAYQTAFWSFYGANNLGTVPIERSKGWLSVLVTPTLATVIVRRDGNLIHSGGAPLTKLRLPVGDYSLEAACHGYEKRRSITIGRESLTETNIVFDLGTAALSSEPPDAEFELSGGGRAWRGKLPTQVNYVEAGTYEFVAERKGWRLQNTIEIRHGETVSNQIHFHYGSIQLASEPAGMLAAVNGNIIGRTPTNLTELRPGRYALSITDGANDLSASVTLEAGKAVQQNFSLHYGSASIASSPPGAAVKRKGKTVGTTPMTLERVPTEGTTFELQMEGYALTNVTVRVRENTTTNLTIKMWSERYLTSVENAVRELHQNSFDEARQSIAIALACEPDDARASSLLAEIEQKADRWQQLQVETEQRIAEEAAKRRIVELALLPILSPEEIITNCWWTPAKSARSTTHSSAISNIVDTARTAPAGVPWAVTGEILAAGVKTVLAPIRLFKHKPKEDEETPLKPTRFHQWKFQQDYQGKNYRYFGKIANFDAKQQTILFASGGKGKQSYNVLADLRAGFSNDVPTKAGMTVWVSGRLSALLDTNALSSAANLLVLQDARAFSPRILENNK